MSADVGKVMKGTTFVTLDPSYCREGSSLCFHINLWQAELYLFVQINTKSMGWHIVSNDVLINICYVGMRT